MNQEIEKLKNQNIAVICGGLSSEREISLRTGNSVSEALKSIMIPHKLYDFSLNTLNELIDDHITLAFIALHGRYGEDGTIQGMLDMAKIKYTGCSPITSAVTMSKEFTKYIFKENNIPTPDYAVLKDKNNKENPIGFPVVIKPDTEGSSIGLSIVFDESEFEDKLETAFRYCDSVVLEKYIAGRELTVGIIGNKNPINLPIIEIRPKNKFFDYEAKYTKGMTDYIIPAVLNEKLKEKIFVETSKIYKIFNCSGMCRIDVMADENDNSYYLEINSIPGMTATSLLPKAARAFGLEFSDFVVKILNYALEK